MSNAGQAGRDLSRQFQSLEGHRAGQEPPLRYRLIARDRLDADSDIMLDQTRTIDNRRFMDEILTVLTDRELAEVESYWRIVMGLD